MQCPYCGADSSESKCTFCGSEIPGFTAEAPAQPTNAAAAPVYSEVQPNVPTYANPVATNAPAPVSVTGLWILAVIATICSLLFGVLSIVNVSGVNKAATYEEQQKKIKNAKIFAFIGIGINVFIIVVRLMTGM